MNHQPSLSAKRGRRRSKKAGEDILIAARELLAEKGYHALSYEAISQRTGVGRATIYRRWPRKTHLAHEIAHLEGQPFENIVAEQGLVPQIMHILQRLFDAYRQPEIAAANVGMISDFHRNEALREELSGPIERETRERLAQVIEDAKSHKMVRADADSDVLFDMMVGTVLFRAVFSTEPIPNGYLDRVCRGICDDLHNDC